MFHRTVYDSLSALVVVALGASAVQCSSSSRDGYEAPPDADADADADAAPPEQFVSPVDAAAEANAANGIDQECTGENKQIYVATRSPDEIYRFDPPSLTFTLVGKVDCYPYRDIKSMAIDRRGYAWMAFPAVTYVHVRLSDLECKEILLNNRPGSVNSGGMGFAKDDSGTGESLFIHNGDLFRIDPTTRDSSLVIQTRLPSSELTGTGDGKLFGYSPLNGVITRYDKTTGASLETYRTSAIGGLAWAFAQWGGDFWIFLRQDPKPTSTVFRYSPATDETRIAIENTGLLIVGAGSSTCAPFKPVN